MMKRKTERDAEGPEHIGKEELDEEGEEDEEEERTEVEEDEEGEEEEDAELEISEEDDEEDDSPEGEEHESEMDSCVEDEEDGDVLKQIEDHSWDVSDTPGLSLALKSRRKKELVDTDGDQRTEAEESEHSGKDDDLVEESSGDDDLEDEEFSEEQDEEEENEEASDEKNAKRCAKNLKGFIAEDKVNKIDLNVLTRWRLKRDEMKKEREAKKSSAQQKHSQNALLEEYKKQAEITIKRLEEERLMEDQRRLREDADKLTRWRKVAAEPRKVFVRRAGEEFVRYICCRPPCHAPPIAMKDPRCVVTGKPAKYRTREGVLFADLQAYRALRRKRKIDGHGLSKSSQALLKQVPLQEKLTSQLAKKMKRVKRYGPQVCAVTGALNAHYCHPKSGLPYATKEAFARIDVVFQSGGIRACTQEFDLIELDTPLGKQFVPRHCLHLLRQNA